MILRLQLLLSRAGIDSRRRCGEIVKSGSVTVNGHVIIDPAHKVNSEKDFIKVKGRSVKVRLTHRTFLFNKPEGVMVTHSDPQGRETVFDMVRASLPKPIFAAGRLDYLSEGAIILSTDGELINRLTHPKHKISKVYLVKFRGKIEEETLGVLRNGVKLSDGMTLPAAVFTQRSRGGNTWLKIILNEGRNRQIRRMGDAVGHTVLKLRRIAIGPIKLGRLARGTWRELDSQDLEALKAAIRN